MTEPRHKDSIDPAGRASEPPSLRILLFEDSEADARLIEIALRRAGIIAHTSRIDRLAELRELLGGHVDVLLCDYSLPGINIHETICEVQRLRPDVPVIIVSGSIGEELAVAAIRAGAEDYLLKDRLERLGIAVQQAVERRRLKRETRVAEETAKLLLRAIEATHQGVVLLDATREGSPIVFANPAFLASTGYAWEEVSGRTLGAVLNASSAAEVLTDGAIDTGEVTESELLAHRKDGTPFWCAVSVEVMRDGERDDSRGPTHLAAVCADVTERRRLEEQFRRMQKMEALGQLAGGVAHDFNNLLFVINAYSQQLADDSTLSGAAHEAAEAIRECGDRGTALTRQLLLFSRNEFVPPSRIDVNETLRDIERMMRRLIRSDITLELKLSPEVKGVSWGPGMLDRAVTNLVLNARDAMPNGGTITIESKRTEVRHPIPTARGTIAPGAYATVSVADSGIGMSKELQERLFEPFFTTKGPDRGTGLGLATVYGTVSQAGGFIDVDSQVGHGSTFTLYLPENGEQAPEVSKQLPLPGGNATVLLVEDDPRVRAVIEEMLRKLGYSVTTAADGTEGMALIDRTPSIDVLVTDIVMPGANGRTLADRALRKCPQAVVLMISGYSDDPLFRSDPSRPGVAHLPKPFGMQALAEKIHALLTARETWPTSEGRPVRPG
jgi:two-component system cell cycle sensor histidine kinase/response regulator CckA